MLIGVYLVLSVLYKIQRRKKSIKDMLCWAGPSSSSLEMEIVLVAWVDKLVEQAKQLNELLDKLLVELLDELLKQIQWNFYPSIELQSALNKDQPSPGRKQTSLYQYLLKVFRIQHPMLFPKLCQPFIVQRLVCIQNKEPFLYLSY